MAHSYRNYPASLVAYWNGNGKHNLYRSKPWKVWDKTPDCWKCDLKRTSNKKMRSRTRQAIINRKSYLAPIKPIECSDRWYFD